MYEQRNKMCYLHNRLHDKNTAVQSQKAVTVYFTSKQLLSFGFAEQCRAEQIWRNKYGEIMSLLSNV